MKSVKKASDLVTSKQATIEGFSWQANEKVERADTYLSHADYFLKNAANITNVEDVRRDSTLTDFFIAACMLSKKSLSHLSIETQNEIINKRLASTTVGITAITTQTEQKTNTFRPFSYPQH